MRVDQTPASALGHCEIPLLLTCWVRQCFTQHQANFLFLSLAGPMNRSETDVMVCMDELSRVWM